MAFDVPYVVCVVVMTTLTCVYIVIGGYMATAINDFIQGIIMIIGIIVVIGAVLAGKGGFMSAIMQLSEISSDVPATMGQSGAFASFFGTFACGVSITVSNMFFKFIASPINAGAFAMIAGLIIVPLVSLITPKMDSKQIDDIFDCYEEKVTVEMKEALPEED